MSRVVDYTAEENYRPNRTTMEGMIWNANHVLEYALSPKINGLPKALFREACGIVVLSSFQMGFILAGTVGTGIAMQKLQKADGSTRWSPPCAVGLSGISFGILLGASAKDVVIFIVDQGTINSLSTKHGFKLGSQFELAAGFGRTVQSDFDFSKGGVGTTLAIGYVKGAFAGISLEGAALGTREFVNNKFYGKVTTAKDILDNKIPIPEGKITMMGEVYDKLSKLESGATAEPDSAEAEKKQKAKAAAEKEHESIKDLPEVVSFEEAMKAEEEEENKKEKS